MIIKKDFYRYFGRISRSKRKSMKASVAVEAAFIVPFILFVTLAVMVFIFMLYNRIKMTGDINLLLEHARESEHIHGKVDPAELTDRWRELGNEGYLFCSVTDPVIDIRRNEIGISAGLEMITPMGRLCERLVESFGVLRIKGSISTESREKVMRMLDAGQELLK